MLLNPHTISFYKGFKLITITLNGETYIEINFNDRAFLNIEKTFESLEECKRNIDGGFVLYRTDYRTNPPQGKYLKEVALEKNTIVDTLNIEEAIHYFDYNALSQCRENKKNIYYKTFISYTIDFALLIKEYVKKNHPPRRKAISKKLREKIYLSYNKHCAYCGKELPTIKDMQVDHVKSHMYNCGEDIEENYLPSCKDCNLAKSYYSLEDFRKEIIDQYARIARKRKIKCSFLSDRIAQAYGVIKEDKEIKFYFEKENTKNG